MGWHQEKNRTEAVTLLLETGYIYKSYDVKEKIISVVL